MFKIKRPAIVGLLLILLMFTGYLNYELTQQALIKTSKDYKKHEEVEKANNLKDSIEVNNENLDIVDTDKGEDENVSEVVSTGNKDIEKSVEEDNDKSRNYFVEYRLSRDKVRAGIVERLDAIVSNEDTVEKIRSEAQEEIIKIGRNSEKELQIEGLIKAKGFTEVVTFLTDEDIKVVVSSKELSEQDMVKILDIVKSETKFDVGSIKISKK